MSHLESGRVKERCLASTITAAYRDLERKNLSDVNAFHALSLGVLRAFQGGLVSPQRTRRWIKVLSKKLEEGSKFGRHLLAGALSATLSKTVVAPVERIRMDIILRNTPHGPLETAIDVFRMEGLTGFWRGNLLNIIRTAPFKAMNFYTFDAYCAALLSLGNRTEITDLERFAAGAMAGVTSLIACFPLDTVRTRILSSRTGHEYRGLVHALTQIVRQEGFSALYQGCIPGILSIAPSSAVFYGVYGTLKHAHLKREAALEKHRSGLAGTELPVMHSLLYGAIAGICAEFTVYPLEIIRRKLQQQTRLSLSHVPVRNEIIHSFALACNNIIRTEGIGGFYSGALLNTVQVLPSAALSYFFYETFKALLKVDNQNQN